MRTYAVGWLLLLIFTDSGVVKHMGDYDSQKDCHQAWEDSKQCLKKVAEKEKASSKDCFIYCGQPIGFCLEAERLTVPGVIFPLPKDDKGPCD